MLEDKIILNEVPNKYIQFELDSSEGDYIMEYSLTLKLDELADLGIELIKHIQAADTTNPTSWSGVEFLTLIFIKSKEPRNLPEPLLRLGNLNIAIPNNNPPKGNGMAVTIHADHPNMMILHKPKRTKGKVSNSLG